MESYHPRADACVPHALQVTEPRPAAAVVVYGIAHTGGGAGAWNAVAAAVPSDTEIRAIRLPGREKRLKQPPHRTVDAAAAEIARVIAADARDHGKPFVVAGSCAGGLPALAAVGKLEARGEPVRALVTVHLPAPRPAPAQFTEAVERMSSAELRDWLRDKSQTPAAVLDNDVFYGFFEPVFRADMAMMRDHVPVPDPIRCPVFLLRAARGTSARPDLGAWRAVVAGRVREVTLACGGEPLSDAPRELADALAGIAHGARWASPVPGAGGLL